MLQYRQEVRILKLGSHSQRRASERPKTTLGSRSRVYDQPTCSYGRFHYTLLQNRFFYR